MVFEDNNIIRKNKNIYYLYRIIEDIETEIEETILNTLPNNISEKIDYITVESYTQSELYLLLTVSTKDIDEVYDYVIENYPSLTIDKDEQENISDIIIYYHNMKLTK